MSAASSDPTAHVSVNFLGAPALTLRQYPAYKQNISSARDSG